MEDWLYEDGEDEKKSVYVAKLGDLKALGDPIEQRAADDAGRAGERGKGARCWARGGRGHGA
jgi:heat shock protein 4